MHQAGIGGREQGATLQQGGRLPDRASIRLDHIRVVESWQRRAVKNNDGIISRQQLRQVFKMRIVTIGIRCIGVNPDRGLIAQSLPGQEFPGKFTFFIADLVGGDAAQSIELPG